MAPTPRSGVEPEPPVGAFLSIYFFSVAYAEYQNILFYYGVNYPEVSKTISVATSKIAFQTLSRVRIRDYPFLNSIEDSPYVIFCQLLHVFGNRGLIEQFIGQVSSLILRAKESHPPYHAACPSQFDNLHILPNSSPRLSLSSRCADALNFPIICPMVLEYSQAIAEKSRYSCTPPEIQQHRCNTNITNLLFARNSFLTVHLGETDCKYGIVRSSPFSVPGFRYVEDRHGRRNPIHLRGRRPFASFKRPRRMGGRQRAGGSRGFSGDGKLRKEVETSR